MNLNYIMIQKNKNINDIPGRVRKLDWVLNIGMDIRYSFFNIIEYGYGFKIK